ncbi:MAG: Response regulator receiver protein [candidate division CPR2 bacterium GW2011_GWC1_41_48]|uniref:Response regulator receiver protein n=1 Tax=candidate division CPR2 bacterium GW2011_GWC1_41_48 TaxID=1618344 RepID=A0A0G0W6Q7_UNCC2|nr:MAG: Response regulator receiver protein [candidate division CPR2 bacterium GW2011_GWC2_39_35]KKS08635.1 MAG: Response regulator receiver protein [candidate division CPR2 bacterium GW2011_GWC1_41_48]HCL99303.1 response regulator [candidate division CPR2 bacterium]
MKVLVTDDSAFMRAIIKAAIKEVDPNTEVLEAENGDVAVELYREHNPEMVFLDIIMPVKNGIMAMEELRELNSDLKIVIVTSVGQEDMINKAKELGANGFIPKPFQPDQIKEIFNQLRNI